MLMNFKALQRWLNKRNYLNEEYSFDKIYESNDWHNLHTPIKYEGVFKYVGYVNVWNSVGCIEYTFNMYKPFHGGTILYDVE